MAAVFLVTALIVPATAAVADDVGSVAGTVSVPGGHDVTGVDLYLASPDGASVVAGPVHPDGTGAYGFAGLADGSYTVFAETPSDTLAWQWSGGGRDVSEASSVSVAGGGAVTGVDLALVVGASISGTITVPAGYSPEDSGAFADRPAGSPALAPPGTTTAAGQYTFAASDGSYAIAGLPDLTWLVRFPTTGHSLLVQYYPGAYSVGSATTLSPSAGQALTGIDATLEEIHNLRIGGTFKDAGSSLCYAYRNADSSVTGGACTDAGVAEESLQVRPGDYIVSAWESNATRGVTPTLWWNDTAADRTVEANATAFAPDPLSVSPGAVAAFDFTGLLFPGDPTPRSITFTVTNWADGSPATGGCMRVYSGPEALVAQDCVPAGSTYRVTGLPDGSYRIKFNSFSGAAPNQWYGPAATFDAAAVVPIGSGAGFVGEHVVLEPYSLTGRVQDAAGQPLSGGRFEVWSRSSTSTGPIATVAVAPDGSYATGGVSCPDGSCKVRFVGFPGVADEWYLDAAEAGWYVDLVSPSASAPVVLSTATLDWDPGTLAGTISLPFGFTSPTACVVLYDGSDGGTGRPLAISCGAAGDSFEFTHLAPARYVICIADTPTPTAWCSGNGYRWTFYGGTSASDAFNYGPSLTVAEGSTTTVSSLLFGGTITARPTTLLGLPATGGCMDVYDTSTETKVGSDCLGSGGNFVVRIGVDGEYGVLFRGFPGLDDQWFSNTGSSVYYTIVSVGMGATEVVSPVVMRTPSVDGRITVQVLNPTTGSPQSDGCMRVWDSKEQIVGETCSSNGSFTVSSLPDGKYRVAFFGFAGAATYQWYGRASSFWGAREVVIFGGAHVNLSYRLLPPYSLAGTVVDALGNPRTGGFVEIWASGSVSPAARVPVAADGTWATGQLGTASASYSVRFTGFTGIADEWYQDKNEASGGAASLQASVSQTPVVSATLNNVEGILSGTIAVPSDFSGDTACVVLMEANTGGRPLERACGTPGAPFEFRNRAHTSYTLCVADTADPTLGCSGTVYPWAFVGGSTAASATRFPVTAGNTTTATVAFGGTITGAVTGPLGVPASGGCMDVYATSTATVVGSDCTGDAGSYAVYVGIDSTTVTSYKVRLRDFPGMRDQWYGHAASLATSTAVALVQGGTATLSAVTLIESGTGSVALTLSNWADALPPSGGCLEVFDASQVLVGADCTGSGGTYSVSGLMAGDYRAELASFAGAAPTQWFGSAPTFGGARVISIADGTAFSDTYALLQPRSIVGSVRDSSASPLTGGYVEIWDATGYAAPVARVAVHADGTWATGQLTCTSCRIRVTGFAGFADEWWGSGNVFRGTAAQVVATSTSYPVVTTGLVLDVVPGSVAGSIAKPDAFGEGTVCVVLYEYGTSGRPLGRSCGAPGDAFVFPGVAAGDYAVCVANTTDPSTGCSGSSYAWDFVGGTLSSTASRFAVTSGNQTVPALVFGGTISGSPTDTHGAAVTGGCMDVFAATTSALVGSDCTEDAGVYSVAVGSDSSSYTSYRVQFRDFPGYLNRWHAAAATLASATAVAVQAGGSTGLAPTRLLSTATGSIELTLTNWADAQAASGGCMEVYDATQFLVGTDCVGAAGLYIVPNLTEGDYRVKLANFAGAAPTQWYGPGSTFTNAAVVTVASASATSASATLLLPRSIAGRVQGAGAAPLTGGFVEVWNASSGLRPVATISVAADGTFSTGSLTCNNCRIRLSGFAGLAAEWYADAASSSSSASVLVSATTPSILTTSTIDRQPGTIEGTIAGPANFSGGTTCVLLYEPATYTRVLGTRCGDVGDAFAFTGLAATSFNVCVADTADPTADCAGTGYLWSPVGGTTVTGGTRFAVVAGATTTVALAFGGTITSTPTVAGGAVLSGGCMDVYAGSSGSIAATDCEATNGSFSVSVGTDSSAFSGGYRVRFRDFKNGLDEWYNNATSQAASTQVNLNGGGSVNLAIQLAPWGLIAGTITLPESLPDEQGCVLAFDDAETYVEGEYFEEACSDPETGDYLLSVPPGAYRLEFYVNTPDAATEWYDNSRSRATSTPVTVTSGGLSLVSIDLAVASDISGDVTVDGGGAAVGGVVRAYTEEGDFVLARAVDGSGHYVLDSLGAGTYQVYFEGYDDWGGEWYDNATAPSRSTTITLGVGDHAVADAVLGRVAALSGVVSGPAGAVASGGCVRVYGEEYDFVVEECADSVGAYSFGLAAGTYYLQFVGFVTIGGTALAGEWWGHEPSLATAVPVSLTSGQVLTLNTQLGAGGVVRGTVIAGWYSSPAQDGCVYALETVSRDLAGVDCVAGDGTYSMALVPGTYLLLFSGFVDGAGNPLSSEWFNDAPTWWAATTVTVSASTPLTANARLLAPVSISGAVSFVGGGVADGTVELYDRTTETFVTSVDVNPDGTYRFDDVNASTYYVFFRDFTGAGNSWYPGQVHFNTYYYVNALNGDVALGTMWLYPEAIFVGTMSVPSWFTGTTACATMWWADDGYFVDGYCGPVGKQFEIPNLPQGSYVLEFTDAAGHSAYLNSGAPFTLQAIAATTDRASIPAGDSVTVTAIVGLPPSYGTAYLQYFKDGVWNTLSSPITVSGAAGYFAWTPSQTYTYRILFGRGRSNEFTVTVTAPTVSVVADAPSIPAGAAAGATATVSPAPASGSAYLQYLLGSTWVEFAAPVAVVAGQAQLTWTPSKTFTYRFRFGTSYSDPFTITVVPPTVTAAADAPSIPAGGTAGATATIDPVPGSGSAYLQYLSGSTWVEFASPIAVVAGQAHLTWTPSRTFTYRFRFGTSYSGQFTITVTPPTVTAVADSASIPGGGTAGATATVAPAPGSGSAYLQYLSGSTWVEFAAPVAVVAGQAHLTWTPSKTFTYRFRFGTSYSDSFTITVTPPTVTASPDAPSIPGGGTAGATATVAPAPSSGSAYLQYLSGSTWVEFASPVAVVAGQAHLTWTPSKTFTYRFRFGTSYSDSFTITVAAPTVTASPDAPSIPGGGTAGATATVAPAPGSGSAYLQYLSGSTWVEFASPVAVVAGQAHLTWTPSKTFTYRFRFGTSYSDSFTITVAAPTVTGTADAASIPGGGTAGATATVAPAPSSGSAYLQYLSGSTWVEFAAPVAVVAGQAHLTWTPSRTFTYRFRFGSTYSATFTVTVVPTA